jgi:hypothetical protein
MNPAEIVLTLVCLAALVKAAVRRHLRRQPVPPPEADLAAPYREGLHAAIRVQAAALELERQLHVEAIRHAKDTPGR